MMTNTAVATQEATTVPIALNHVATPSRGAFPLSVKARSNPGAAMSIATL
jgi:hypothetical protein